MYELKVKETEDKQQDSSLRRGHTSNIQRRQMPSSKNLRIGQPNIFKAAQRKAEQGKPNQTGLPDTLKLGIENLSGISMDDVRVHYNSSKPAQLQALAYTKGTDIHIAPGQTKHLPHEAWHVVQQKQGRVMPTMRFGGDLINDNPALEREADCMGAKAVQGKFKDGAVSVKNVTCCCVQRQMPKADLFTRKYDVVKNSFVSSKSTMVMKTPLKADDKIAALQMISEEAAQIGNIVRDSWMADSEFFYAVIKAKYETHTQKDMKRETKEEMKTKINEYMSQIEELDDNIYAETYMKDGYREEWEEAKRKLEEEIAPVTLSLTYQFRKGGVNLNNGEVGGPGYIVSVEKNRIGRVPVIGKMINSRGGHVNTTDSYSNKHEQTEGSEHKSIKKSILGDTYKRSKAEGIKSKNFDAYTKLAGEGARFQCVRRNIATINDNTVIHVRGQSVGVKFSQLWLTWSASFDKKYDIRDSEIKDRLEERSDKNGQQKDKNTLLISPGRYTAPAPVDNNDHIELEEND